MCEGLPIRSTMNKAVKPKPFRASKWGRHFKDADSGIFYNLSFRATVNRKQLFGGAENKVLIYKSFKIESSEREREKLQTIN